MKWDNHKSGYDGGDIVMSEVKRYIMNEPSLDYSEVHTSKGNQLKWRQDGYWYKADQFGYEGIAEYVVTHFLGETVVPFSYVTYEPIIIEYEGREYYGCRSKDYYITNPHLQGYEQVPLERLHRQFTAQNLSDHIALMSEVGDRVRYAIDFVTDITGLDRFNDYLSFLIQTDAFFCNEDRHLNNIAVMWNPVDDTYDYCPYYDFGLSLFADTREDYPLTMNVEQCKELVKARPFSESFVKQVEACRSVSDIELAFRITREHMGQEVKGMLQGIDVDERIVERIVWVLSDREN